jgi:arsenate reductase-like glutaredoxin family protein
MDSDARAFKDAGLGYLRMDPDEILERLLANAGLLKLPLVRAGNEVSVGIDEAAWKRMAAAETAPPQ